MVLIRNDDLWRRLDLALGFHEVSCGQRRWRFDNPHEFDFRRPPEQSRNLTFSFGSHSCQGRLLAEAEVRVVWERIAARYPRIELAGDPVIKNTDASRHYYSLPLRLCR